MTLTDRFTDALVYAAQLHQAQVRKLSGTPYVAHLLRVAGIVLEHGADEDEAIAALLHDAVEDQGGEAAREGIRRQFGPRVAEIVDGCSDTDQTPKPPWRERKTAYLARLTQASTSVRLVSAADKLDNARSLIESYHAQGESIWEFFRGGREGTLWYFHSVVEVLKRAGSNRLVEELDRAVTELDRVVAPP
jgi:GTP pyrophosphokinase